MGYVTSNLMPEEEVIYLGSIHWFIFAPSLILFLVGISLFGVDTGVSLFGVDTFKELGPIIGWIVIFFSLGSLANALITKFSTELAVTTKRVIAKVGFISRKTVELNHSKVESFTVEQNIPGRIFDFGTIEINGTGGGKNAIRNIDSPLEFRRQAMKIIDTVSHN